MSLIAQSALPIIQAAQAIPVEFLDNIAPRADGTLGWFIDPQGSDRTPLTLETAKPYLDALATGRYWKMYDASKNSFMAQRLLQNPGPNPCDFYHKWHGDKVFLEQGARTKIEFGRAQEWGRLGKESEDDELCAYKHLLFDYGAKQFDIALFHKLGNETFDFKNRQKVFENGTSLSAYTHLELTLFPDLALDLMAVALSSLTGVDLTRFLQEQKLKHSQKLFLSAIYFASILAIAQPDHPFVQSASLMFKADPTESIKYDNEQFTLYIADHKTPKVGIRFMGQTHHLDLSDPSCLQETALSQALKEFLKQKGKLLGGLSSKSFNSNLEMTLENGFHLKLHDLNIFQSPHPLFGIFAFNADRLFREAEAELVACLNEGKIIPHPAMLRSFF